ncbi:uncharacterized protein LOC120279604 [Dioscorea cayenensis subsp. rotundata]|uniref:Uncharacterized protein LOC120279604 n=1 Tax=Dioscorea cayennensis subsp. rotundata TaxID=55577 RepID=A0AB40CVF2_DIOCR|nr:uncharacterized protein LOC120279604 [Dioscorea cayenensis subsp. rotundata]
MPIMAIRSRGNPRSLPLRSQAQGHQHPLQRAHIKWIGGCSSIRSLSGGVGFVAMLLNLGTYCQMDEVYQIRCRHFVNLSSSMNTHPNGCRTMELINEVPPINVDGRIAAC